jgi:hypothetical protein
MASREDGWASAEFELWSGYPAYFYRVGNGSYIRAMDEQHGVPIMLCGDFPVDGEWMYGFNRGVAAHLKKHGPAWNSRQSSLKILANLRRYFRRHAARSVRLEMGGEPFRPEGYEFTLTLMEKENEEEFQRPSVKLETSSLFHDPAGIMSEAMWPFRSGPPRMIKPSVRQAPLLRAGTKEVWLRFFSHTRYVECVPAPPGSHLVVFRFSDFAAVKWKLQAEEWFAALDTQLGDWLPGCLLQAELGTPTRRRAGG